MQHPSLDTNILLRLLLGDVQEQQERVLTLLRLHESFEISDLAITEMVFVLEHVLQFSRREISELLRRLIENQHLNLNRALFSRVLPLYYDHRSISFNDCCLAIYAELNEADPLYTFDKALAKKLPRLVKEV